MTLGNDSGIQYEEVPSGDLITHISSDACSCNPSVDETYDNLLLHHKVETGSCNGHINRVIVGGTPHVYGSGCWCTPVEDGDVGGLWWHAETASFPSNDRTVLRAQTSMAFID